MKHTVQEGLLGLKGQVNSENPKKLRMKLRSKMGIEVNSTKQVLRGRYRIKRKRSRFRP